MNKYLEKEPIGKLMLKFCVPCVISLLVSCFYNIIDQMFVGNGIGYVANAATGIIFPITVLGWGLSLWFGDGAAASYSLALGQNSETKISSYVGQAVWMTFLSGALVSLLFFLFPTAILSMVGASEATMDMALTYGRIILFFMPLAMVQNALAPLIRAHGAPGFALASMVLGALINIVGDYLTVFVWNMGIAGAAWATITGQVISLLLCLGYFIRPHKLLQWSDLLPQWKLDSQICALGTSSLIAQLSVVVITIVNNILLVKYGALSIYGSEIPLAAFVVLMKLFQVVINAAIGIAAGAQPIAGVNYAAGHYDRVRSLFARMALSVLVISGIATILFLAIPQVFVAMFGTGDALYVQLSVQVLRIYLSLIILTCLQKICAIFLQSIGKAGKAAFLSLLRDGLLVIFSILLPMRWGLNGIFAAAPAADILAFVITAAMMVPVFAHMRQEENDNLAASRAA